MKYYIVEIQNDNGSYNHIVQTADNRQQAESIYHQVLSYAAISTLASHTAVLLTDEGFMIMSQCYKHATEPEENEQNYEG